MGLMRDPLATLIPVGPSRLGMLRHLGLCGLGSGVTNAPLLILSEDEGRKTKMARPPVRRLVISFFSFSPLSLGVVGVRQGRSYTCHWVAPSEVINARRVWAACGAAQYPSIFVHSQV